jgi:serine/threonine protein kinase
MVQDTPQPPDEAVMSAQRTRATLLMRVKDLSDQARWEEFVLLHGPFLLRCIRRVGVAEQEVKAAGDIYSTGATLYWLLAGQFVRDFEACDRRGERIDPYIVLLEHKVNLHGPGRPPIPEAVIRVLEKALTQEPEDRYETAAAMSRALRKALVESG